MDDNEYSALRLENQLCFPLYATARKVTGMYTPYLKPLGITYTQYVTFMVLWTNDGITVSDLGKKLYLDNGTLTPLLKKLEKEGYLSRVRSEKDERVVTIHLSEKGWALRDQCRRIPEQIQTCLPLKNEDAVKLYKLLYQILNAR